MTRRVTQFIVLIAVAYAVSALPILADQAAPPARPQAAGGFARPEALVDATWLAAHLTDANVRVVDMRGNGYAAGHIPGAVLLSNNAIRSTSPPTFVPTQAEFEAVIGRMGISNRTRVIAYDDRGGIYAARLWWILHYYGHTNVALLDGGWTQWTKENRPASPDAVTPTAATFTAKADPKWIATAQDVLAATKIPTTAIVDARTAAEIAGSETRNIKRGGAIPASIPVYWEDALNPDTRTFRTPAEIRKLYTDKGVTPDREVIAYCQIGMRASHDLFVLYLLGYDKLRNYYGAWDEWGNRDDLPIKK